MISWRVLQNTVIVRTRTRLGLVVGYGGADRPIAAVRPMHFCNDVGVCCDVWLRKVVRRRMRMRCLTTTMMRRRAVPGRVASPSSKFPTK